MSQTKEGTDPGKPKAAEVIPGEHGGNPPPALSAELNVPQAIIDRFDTAQEENKRHNEKQFCLGVLTLAGIAAYTGVALLQWCGITEQARLTREALVVSQRPWVLMTNIISNPVVPTVGMRYTPKLIFHGSGQSPALNVVINQWLDVVQFPQCPPAEAPPKDLMADSVDTVGPARDPVVQVDKTFTQRDIDALKSSEATLCLHGYATFDDEFGGHYMTNFCVFYDRIGSTYVTCTKNNHVRRMKSAARYKNQ